MGRGGDAVGIHDSLGGTARGQGIVARRTRGREMGQGHGHGHGHGHDDGSRVTAARTPTATLLQHVDVGAMHASRRRRCYAPRATHACRSR